MPIRVLLILSLVLQPLLLAAATARMAPGCEQTSCCLVVEKTTCCGETVTETICPRSGGACLCGVMDGSDKDADPAPAPAPDRTDLSSLVLATGSAPVHVLPSTPRTLAPPATTGTPRTHNETQALLCIWRT